MHSTRSVKNNLCDQCTETHTELSLTEIQVNTWLDSVNLVLPSRVCIEYNLADNTRMHTSVSVKFTKMG